MPEQPLRIFVSSPSDVAAERSRVRLVADRLNGELQGRVHLEVLRWEDAFYTAAHSFQEAIDAALGNMSATDMVLCIVWKRAGLKLDPGIWHRPDGSGYESGTVLEFETAVEVSRKHNGIPDVYLFRKSADVLLRAERASEELEQYQLLQSVWRRWTESREGYNTAGYQSFTDTDDFEQKLEACLRQWLERRGVVAKAVWDRTLKGSPFRGLATFEASHAPVFFGRDSAIVRAIAKLRKIPFLLLIGASGSGKSSLMRAGLVPRITAPGVIAEVDSWRTAIISPASEPLSELAQALFDDNALGAELRAGDFSTPQSLAELFALPGQAALSPTRSALARAAQLRKETAHYETVRPVRLVIAIDQVERLFVEAEPAKVEAFAALLRSFVEAGLANVIGALRSDAYGRFQSVESFLALLENNGTTLDLLPPSPAEIEDIVSRPVAACHPSLAYEVDGKGQSLAEVLVADAKGGDSLPLLQMTLQRLYDAQERRGDGVLRFADYPGMAAAVTRTAEEAVARLDATALAALPQLITALVRDVTIGPDGSLEALTIVPVSRTEFERNDPGRKALIDEFVAQRLLTTEAQDGAGRVRPVHEALLRVVPQAVSIIKENAALIRVRYTLASMVTEWLHAVPDAKQNFLATSPALIAGAAQLLERFGDDLPAEMKAFISDSLAADARRRESEQRRQRRILFATAAGLVIALSLAGLAGWQWQVANTQRARAQTALNAATNTAETLVFDLAREFKARPGMPVDLVNSILERVQSLQRQLAAAGSTPDLRRLEAVSLNELSDAFLSQGNGPAALTAAERSLAIMQVLVKEFPNLPLLQRDLAITLNQLGDVRRAEQNWPLAQEAYRRALAIVETFVAINPDDIRWQRDLWLSYNKIADVQAITGPRDEALTTYRKGLAAIQALLVKRPEDPLLRADLAFNYNRIAILLGAAGDYEQALEMYRNALLIHEQLAVADAENTDRQRDVFVSYNRVAGALAALGRRAEAIATFGKAIAKMEQLAPTDLGNAQWQRDLVGVYEQIGQLLAEDRQREQALQNYAKALAARERLVAITPANLQWQYELAAGYLKYANMLLAAERRDDAIAYFRRSIPVFELLIGTEPGKLDRQRDLSIAYLNIGDALAGAQKWLEARAVYEQCRAIRERLAPQNTDNLLWQRDLAFVLERIANSFAKTNDYSPALADYRRALEIRKTVRRAEPANVSYQRELALAHSFVAETLYELGQKQAAQASFLAAFAIVENYAANEPENVRLQMDLVTGLYRLAFFIEEESQARHARALAIVQGLDAKGMLSAADKDWAAALERWFSSRPK